MKNWATYLVSSALGILFYFLFGQYEWFPAFTLQAVTIIEGFCRTVFPALVFLTLGASIASFIARRDIGGKVFFHCFVWALATSLILSVFAALMFFLFPFEVPPANNQFAANPAGTAALSVHGADNLSFSFILVCAAAVFLGFAFRPTSSIFGPAYSLLNSLSEVVYRLCKDFSRIWWIPLFFLSAYWMNEMAPFEGFSAFIPVIAVVTAGSVLVIIPLLYFAFTLFRSNPYKRIFRLIPAVLPAFFAHGMSTSSFELYAAERNNLGIQKRVVSFTIPSSMLLARGGSAAMGTLLICSIFSSGGVLNLQLALYAAIVCSITCFICVFVPEGSVIFALTAAALSALGSSIPVPAGIMILLPVLGSAGAVLDILIAGLSGAVCGVNFDCSCEICAKDTI